MGRLTDNRKMIIAGLLWLAFWPGYAQQLSPQVTYAPGFGYKQQAVFVDMSVGELAITTISTAGQTITQGFLQPIKLSVPCSDAKLAYYPNPVISTITLAATDCDLLVDYVEAYDLFGKLVLQTTTVDNVADLSAIGVGVYLLRAYTADRQLLGVAKIVKTTI